MLSWDCPFNQMTTLQTGRSGADWRLTDLGMSPVAEHVEAGLLEGVHAVGAGGGVLVVKMTLLGLRRARRETGHTTPTQVRSQVTGKITSAWVRSGHSSYSRA